MSLDLPIACTLGAGDYRDRLADIAALGDLAFRGAERTPRHAVLRFAPGAEVRERLDAIVAAEARCCAFLSMTLASDSDATTLTIDGPDSAEPVIAELVDAFSGRPTASAR